MMRPSIPALLVVATLAAAPLAVLAQYKVVGPDGSVTYTDRPPTASGGKISALSRRGEPAALGGGSDLPFELRQVAGRYPVTIYTTGDCTPCDSGRQLLQRRGVPYVERTVNSDDDAAALERLVGGRTVPSLTIGGQGLRGFQDADWNAYLDAAGYPKTSRLPRGWQPPAAAPLVQRAAPARALAEPAAPAAPADEPTVPTLEAGRIRF